MEKKYTKIGYSYVNVQDKTVVVSKQIIEKSIVDQKKLLGNIQQNLINLQNDLDLINTA